MSSVAWDELSVTHESRPRVSEAVVASAGPIGTNTVVEFDVTSAVSGSGLYAFGIVGESSNGVIYQSREAETGRPELILALRHPCDDGNACTQGDACEAGTCVGEETVACSARDQCDEAAVCDPATGACIGVPKVDGTACDDGDRCTQRDTCVAGVCIGSDSIACSASDQCHEAGTCDPATGTCSNPPQVEGTVCDDGDRCIPFNMSNFFKNLSNLYGPPASK